jgi:hypothetical protein
MSSLRFTLIHTFRKAFNLFNLEIDKLSPRSNPDLQLVCALKKFNIDLVLDIGANEGQFTRRIIKIFPQAHIYAFEPLTIPYQQLAEFANKYPKKIPRYPNICGINIFD